MICTSGKARELYTETILPKVMEGRAEAGARAPDYARMIEVKVSFDTDKQRAMEDTRHWAVLALTPEEKVSVHSLEEMERLADGLWPSAPPAAGSSRPIRMSMSSGSAIMLTSASTIWSFTRRVLTRSNSSGVTRSTFCLACVADTACRTRRAGAHDLSRGHRP